MVRRLTDSRRWLHQNDPNSMQKMNHCGNRGWKLFLMRLLAAYAGLALISDTSLFGRRALPGTASDEIPQGEQFAPPPPLIQRKILEAEETFPSCRNKVHFLTMILSSQDAGAPVVSDELCARLPTLSEVELAYGPAPLIVGPDTCREYRRILGSGNKAKPRVAGLYHTATNALAQSFHANIEDIGKILKVDAYNAPWGKHMPPSKYRLSNQHPKGRPPENLTQVLPVVIVRDPYFWMQAMCKAPYDAHWVKLPDRRCPNLWNEDRREAYRVYALTHQSNYTQLDTYESMVHFWSEWNGDYLRADYPRLIVRFEDVLYRLKDVLTAVRNCIGMEQSNVTLRYQTSSSKKHGNPAGVLESLTKYLNYEGRHIGLKQSDRRFANQALDQNLMKIFQYRYAPEQASDSDLEGPFPDLGLPPGPIPDISELKIAG